jgi:hypothetical protein
MPVLRAGILLMAEQKIEQRILICFTSVYASELNPILNVPVEIV